MGLLKQVPGLAHVQGKGSTWFHGTEVSRVMLSIASPGTQTRLSGPSACVCTLSHSASCFLICFPSVGFASVPSRQCYPDIAAPGIPPPKLHLEGQHTTVFNALGSGARYLGSTRQLCGLGQLFLTSLCASVFPSC